MTRKATNVSLTPALVEEARTLGINLSKACERGLRDEIAAVRAAHWQRENQAAIDAWNTEVEANGLPLDRFRQF